MTNGFPVIIVLRLLSGREDVTRTTLFSLAGLALVALLLIACVGPGLAVRAGLIDEMLFWLPPEGRYQMIVRVGNDASPWDLRGGRQAAINVWLHDRERENWHLLGLARLPLGGDPLPADPPQNPNQYQYGQYYFP
jgi:hypothetical protein